MSSNLKIVLPHRQYVLIFMVYAVIRASAKKKKKNHEQNDGQTLDVTLPVNACLVCYK